MDDDVRLAFQNKNKKNRAEIDAHNSKECPPKFFELASNLHHDKDFNPVTNAYPNLHKDFAGLIVLFNDEAPQNVTPEKIKEKLADVHAKLVIIVSNWEKSGNCGGNRDMNDPESRLWSCGRSNSM
jgi:hypothetical protein